MYVCGIVGPEALVGDADGALVDRAAGHGHGRVDGQPRVVVVGQVGRARRAGRIAVPRGVAAFARLSPTPHCQEGI